jgi:hypothetical protein
MKIEIAVNGTKYTAEYNVANNVHGFDSKSDFYAIYVANERAIERAASAAYEAAGANTEYNSAIGQTHTLTTKSGTKIDVTVYPN